MSSDPTKTFTVEDLNTYQRIAARLDPGYQARMYDRYGTRDPEALLDHLNGGLDRNFARVWDRLFRNGVEFFDADLGYVTLPNIETAYYDDLKSEYLATLKTEKVGRESEPVVGVNDRASGNGTLERHRVRHGCYGRCDEARADTLINFSKLIEEFGVLLGKALGQVPLGDKIDLDRPQSDRAVLDAAGYRGVSLGNLMAQVRRVQRNRNKQCEAGTNECLLGG